MKFHKQVAIALVAVSASLFGFGSVASAGEGAAAGAVAATLDENGLVIEMTAAGAIGKNNAAALATSNSGVISATALGSAGVIEIISDSGNFSFSEEGGQSDSDIYNNVTIIGGEDSKLETAQANSIATFTDLPIGTIETGF